MSTGTLISKGISDHVTLPVATRQQDAGTRANSLGGLAPQGIAVSSRPTVDKRLIANIRRSQKTRDSIHFTNIYGPARLSFEQEPKLSIQYSMSTHQ
jgi:hypothetical protein